MAIIASLIRNRRAEERPAVETGKTPDGEEVQAETCPALVSLQADDTSIESDRPALEDSGKTGKGNE